MSIKKFHITISITLLLSALSSTTSVLVHAETANPLSASHSDEYRDMRDESIKQTLDKYNKDDKIGDELPVIDSKQKNSTITADWLGLDKKFLGIRGYIETRNYFDLKKDNDEEYTYESRNNIRLIKELGFTPKLRGMASFEGKLYYLMNKTDGFEDKVVSFRPWELYLDYYAGTFDIRLGQQIIRWGKADGVNPTDVFTPEDLTEFFNYVNRAERKLPISAAKINYYYNDEYSLQAIYLPFFKKTQLDNPGGDWEPYLSRLYRSQGLTFSDDKGPTSKKFSNGSFAGKLIRQGENADASLSYSYHYSETPALELKPTYITVAGFPVLSAEVEYVYPRQHTIGGDFETVIGRVGLRGEGAFTTKTPFVSYNPEVTSTIVYKNSFLYVVGGDYTFPNNLYVNLEYSQQWILDSPGELATQDMEDSILWRIIKNYRYDTIRLRTTGRYFLSCGDMLFQADVRYKLTDNLHITTGFYLYGGHVDGIFGQYRKNDQAFCRIKYLF